MITIPAFTLSQDIAVLGLSKSSTPSTVNATVSVAFSVPIKDLSPGMRMIVENELKNAITRIVEEGSKIP